MSHRRGSSLKTRWIWIPWTKLICIVVALTVSTHVLNDSLPKSWIRKDSTEPPHVFVYLFNWTNMYDPGNAHVKPNFVQLGPFVFRADVRGPPNDTMTTWFFEKQKSIGSLDDLIGALRSPDPIVANRIRSWNQYMRKIMDFTLNTEAGCMMLDKAAMKALFEGHYDPLTEAAKLLATELIPWYLRQHSRRTENSPVNVGRVGPCLTEIPLYMVSSAGNYTNVKEAGGEGIFSHNDLVRILRDVSEFYAPFVIVSERVTMNQTLALLRKLAFGATDIGSCLERVLCC